MAEETTSESVASLSDNIDTLTLRTRNLETGANSFARAMASAFTSSVSGGKQFDDVLKTLALRLSDLSLRLALQPLAKSIVGSFNGLFAGLGGGTGGAKDLIAAMGAIKPFAAGGVVGTPSYFPLASGGMGLAGEAGPEAIVPLARGVASCSRSGHLPNSRPPSAPTIS